MRPYVDVHAHIGVTVSRVPAVGQSPGRYLARMAASGIRAAILCPAAGGSQARGVQDTRDQNQAVAATCRLYPDRFPIGLAIVEVRHQEEGVRELERAMDEGGLLGFMVHPGLSGHSLGAELHPFLEVVAMRRGLCLLHQAGTTAKIAAYARRFPEITFIVGHVSFSDELYRDAVRHCGPCDNVFFDIAQHGAQPESTCSLAELVRDLGPRRLLFGSDTPYYDFRLVQAQIEASDLPDEVKEAIAWENAAHLISRFRPQWQLPETEVEPPQRYSDDELWAARGGRLL